MIKEKGGKWLLYTRDGSRVLGTHPTRERAMAQERAILVRQHMAKQGRSEAASKIIGRVAVEVAEAAARGAAARKGKGKSTKPRLEATPKDIERWRTVAVQKGLKKKADISSMPVPEGLLYEAASGDPHSAAELKRLEESHARQVFGAGSRGPLRSLMARALLGRTRTAGATTEIERKLLESRPELSRLSAAAQPDESYPASRALTTPALMAVPSAGAGAVLARLIAQAAGASSAERELATAAGAGLGGVAGSMATYGLRQRHAKQMGRWMHEKDLADRRSARRQALSLQDQSEGDVPQEGRVVVASIDVPELVPHFLDSLSMIKESRGLLRLFGLGGARGVERAAAQATERAVAQGAERAAVRGAAEAEGRAAARAGARAARIQMPRAEMAEQFRRIAQALPEGDPRRLILESEAAKMVQQMPARPNVLGGIRTQEIQPGGLPPLAEGMVAAPGQESDLIRALLGETEAVGALRQAGKLPGALIPAAPQMSGELAGLQAELAGVGLPLSGGQLPRGTLVPFEEVQGMVMPASESIVPGYGSSILPSPLPARPPIPVTHVQAGPPAGLAPTMRAPVPGAVTEMITGARSPGVGGVQQLVEPPVFGQMAVPTEQLSAQGLVPSEYFRLRTPGAEPMFAFAGPGAPPGARTLQMRAILPQTASQPISTAEMLAPQI